jgi:hypothetical protein
MKKDYLFQQNKKISLEGGFLGLKKKKNDFNIYKH